MSGFSLESLQTKFVGIGLKFMGTETEKRIGTFLFQENIEWATSKDLHGMAALTFNDQECTRVMALISEAMEPANYTWKTLWKAVRLLQHFIVFGAERCVDHAWSMKRQVEDLVRYNSAQHSKTGQIMGAGVDYGEPVRKAAAALLALLGDVERIRDERQAARDPGALLPAGSSDDYLAPDPNAGKLIISRSQDFGVVQTSALGAKFTLEQTPGMYDGRPERYFDKRDDPRRRGSVDDAQWTRQALAPNLLELDIAPLAPPGAPVETQDLVALNRQRQLEEQLRAQQAQLEQLKSLLGGGGAGSGGGYSGVGGGLVAGSSNGSGSSSAAGGSHANILAAFNQPSSPAAWTGQTGAMSGGMMAAGSAGGMSGFGGMGNMGGLGGRGGSMGHVSSNGSSSGSNILRAFGGSTGNVDSSSGGGAGSNSNGLTSMGNMGMTGLGGNANMLGGGSVAGSGAMQAQLQLQQQQQQQLLLQMQLQQQQQLLQHQMMQQQQMGGGGDGGQMMGNGGMGMSNMIGMGMGQGQGSFGAGGQGMQRAPGPV